MTEYKYPFESIIRNYKIPFNPNGARYQNIDEVVDTTVLRGALKSMNLEAMDRNTLTRLALNGSLQ